MSVCWVNIFCIVHTHNSLQAGNRQWVWKTASMSPSSEIIAVNLPPAAFLSIVCFPPSLRHTLPIPSPSIRRAVSKSKKNPLSSLSFFFAHNDWWWLFLLLHFPFPGSCSWPVHCYPAAVSAIVISLLMQSYLSEWVAVFVKVGQRLVEIQNKTKFHLQIFSFKCLIY